MAPPFDPADLRVLIPRARRKLEGAGGPAALTDDQVKDLVADAVAGIILYTNGTGIFGKDLVVTATDPVYGAPAQYMTTLSGSLTSAPLSMSEQVVVVSQAALDFFFFRFSGVRMSEVIADEAQRWEYSLSPTLLIAELKLLQAERDFALDKINEEHALDTYTSFIQVRDNVTSQMIEPWVTRTATAVGLSQVSGQENYVFGGWG